MKFRKILGVLTSVLVLAVLWVTMAGQPVMAVPAITLSATSGTVGSLLYISGSAYSANVTARVHFAYGTSYVLVRTSTVSPTGTIADSFNVPEVPGGTYQVNVETSSTEYAIANYVVIPAIALSATSGRVGGQASISGNGFGASRTVTITFDSVQVATTTSNANGTFTSVTFTVPESQQGSHNIIVSDTINSQTSRFTVEQSAAISPTSASVGATVTVTGNGFRASQTVTVTYDTVAVTTNPSPLVTNANGSFTATFAVPAGPSGSHNVIVNDGFYSATLTISSLAGVKVNPASGNVGTQITISGSGFGTSRTININLDTTQLGTATSDANGSFTSTLNVPASARGAHAIAITDGANTGTAAFAITSSIKSSPDKGPPGAEVTVSGSGFDPNKPVTANFGATAVKTITTDGKGSFSDKFNVPRVASGNYTVSIRDGNDVFNATFTVTVSSEISKTTGNVGMSLTVTGTGFTGTVTIKYDETVVATVTPDASGAVTATFPVPPSIHGDHVIAVSDGLNSLRSAFTMESTPPPVPGLLLPTTETKTDPQASLTWQAVSDPSGVTYALQISLKPDFSTVVLGKQNLTLPQYTLTSIEKLAPTPADGFYYWRVKAIDGAANESAWSAASKFYVSSFPDWAMKAAIGVGALFFALFFFWLGRKTAGGGY
jgi:hypothetical protein